jgi:DNA-binding NarL/FixJ family response regulator
VEKIKLVLVDDHGLVLEALLLLFKKVPGFCILGTACNGDDAVRLTKRVQPDVVLMDLAMPLLDGVSAARQILRVLPRTRIVILSAFLDPAHVRAAVESGVAGFLFKGYSSRELIQSIHEVQKGGRCFPEGYASCVPSATLSKRRRGRSLRNGYVLTRRETEVLRQVARGRANKESASELGVSIKTVEKHRQRLMDKLGIHQTAGLTRYAVAAGLV